ncbi:uncharacterized protein E0L32_001256 [Thyridium curvatum]|uniref:Enoyl reductase (ER) domain-containing protein n=1 Tax=Thyridium curvatum TaxID=1093900 RepID=A0A507AYG2_9PEZI|nr:uncharacterized protein E0L32_001256 [Thyridium curvatum]TPX10059.1 hypothetical protein E0L32_001256 [Thyridium curvatum]
MSLPKTYKQAVFKAAGQPLTIEDAPLELPKKGEILVKVEACGVCYSDMFAQNNVMGGGFPLVPGHEIVGRIAAVGEGVTGWKVGDRVGAGWHGGHDGKMPPDLILTGYHQMCDNAVINGETKAGGYAEYCILRAEATARVPEDVDAAAYAPVLCAGLSVFNSLRHMNLSPGDTVAVQGLGGLGHLAIQYANHFGCRVIALSRGGSDKENFARQLGAHEFVDTSKVTDVGEAVAKLGRAKLIVTTSPQGDAMPRLLKGLGVLGKLLILSVPGDVPFNTGIMLKYGLSVQVWPCGHATDAEDTINFTKLHNIQCMVEKFPLEQANDAFNAMLNGTVRFRAVITMN